MIARHLRQLWYQLAIASARGDRVAYWAIASRIRHELVG